MCQCACNGLKQKLGRRPLARKACCAKLQCTDMPPTLPCARRLSAMCSGSPGGVARVPGSKPQRRPALRDFGISEATPGLVSRSRAAEVVAPELDHTSRAEFWSIKTELPARECNMEKLQLARRPCLRMLHTAKVKRTDARRHKAT